MIPEENGENGEFVLSDILQQAYLSSSAGDKSWVTLKFHFSSQTLSGLCKVTFQVWFVCTNDVPTF